MEIDPGDVAVGLAVAALGLIGLFLAAGAADDEMYVFGLGLFVFACFFDFGLLRRIYDKHDSLRAAARKETHV
jgi:hypothetical protein